MTIFDAPSREQCRARRERTNTPLQAMVTLNDTQYFEAARHLAERMLQETEVTARLRFGFRLVTSRTPTPAELKVVEQTLSEAQKFYAANSDAAAKVLAVGESPASKSIDPKDLASYTIVASLLLNLDEVLTRN